MRGKNKSARLNVTQAMLFVTIVALIPSALMMVFPEETARMLGSSEHLLPMVADYLLWFVPSWVFQIWITVSLFVIRLDGAPKLAMLCSLITAVINVVLDWLFIFPFGWGVMGAAFATSISIMAGGLVAMVYLLFYARHLRLQPLKWSVKSLRLSVRNIGYQCHHPTVFINLGLIDGYAGYDYSTSAYHPYALLLSTFHHKQRKNS